MSKPRDPDSSDLDALRELVRSRGFELFIARVREELERYRVECEHPSDSWVTHVAQGAVRALRTVFDIPSILILEITSEVKHGKTDDGRA